MESLFASPKAKRRVMPPAIRRKIVDLKAEHPPLNLGEMAVESAPTQAIRAAILIRRRGVAEGAQAGRYAARTRQWPEALQHPLFPYLEALL